VSTRRGRSAAPSSSVGPRPSTATRPSRTRTRKAAGSTRTSNCVPVSRTAPQLVCTSKEDAAAVSRPEST
jgi:hypothetical protein